MKRSLAFLSLALPLAACSIDLGSGPLNGSWGGESILLRATPAGVVLTLSCGAVVRIGHAVILDGRRFSVQDSLRGDLGGGAAHDTLPNPAPWPVVPVLITGNVAGDAVTISILPLTNPDVTPDTFEAQRGAPATFQRVCRV